MLGINRQHFQNLLVIHYIQLDSRITQISWVLVDCIGCIFFEPLSAKIWQQAEPFSPMSLEHTALCIFQSLVNLQKDFRSVAIVTYRNHLLQRYLPEEFKRRGLSLPSVFHQYFDLAMEFKECYGREGHSVAEMAALTGDPIKTTQIFSLAKVVTAMLMRQYTFRHMIYIDRVGGRSVLVSQMASINRDDDTDSKFFRLRGLPYRVSKRQVKEFLEVPDMSEQDIFFQFFNEKFNGNAIVKVPARSAEAVKAKHQQHLMNRYIEILPAAKEEFAKIRSFVKNEDRSRERSRNRNRRHRSSDSGSSRKSRSSSNSSDRQNLQEKGILKMVGLPYSCNKSQIVEFFEPYKILEYSIRFGQRNGRRTGDAVLLFQSKRDAQSALEYDKKKIGSRYIELMKISPDQYSRFTHG